MCLKKLLENIRKMHLMKNDMKYSMKKYNDTHVGDNMLRKCLKN